ncbi:MAG: hypothetical protein WBO44_14835, partial [Saprospiraceae bacterium]
MNNKQININYMISNLKMQIVSILIGLLVVVGLPFGNAQNRSLSTMPLLQADNFTSSQVENLNNTPAYDRCLKIYNQLVAARGDFRFPVPS